MDQFSAFMAENVEKLDNKKITVSKRFKDAKGTPIEWEGFAAPFNGTKARPKWSND